MTETAELRTWLLDPLRAVMGTRLMDCRYGILSSDDDTVDVDRPNETGACQVIALTFESGSLLVTRDFREPAFRDEATAFHLSVSWSEARPGGLGADVQTLSADYAYREAARTAVWGALAGELLEGATVWGLSLERPVVWGQLPADVALSPQGVTLSFPSGAAHVVLGMGPNWIGDGDEVLVFGDAVPFPPDRSALIPLHSLAVAGE